MSLLRSGFANFRGDLHKVSLCPNAELPVVILYAKKDGSRPDKRPTSFDDPDLIELFNIEFFAEYYDTVEENTIWNVSPGRSVPGADLSNYEVAIDVNHQVLVKDEDWKNYDKGAAYKIIKLQDCKRLFIETTYLKKDGVVVNNVVIETTLDIETFKNTWLRLSDVNRCVIGVKNDID